MCGLAWHHPLWRLVARRAGSRPLAVWGVVAALRADPLLAGLSITDKVGVLADGGGETPIVVALILAGLQQVQLVDEAGNLTLALGDDDNDENDNNGDEMMTELPSNFVTRQRRRRRGRPPIGLRTMTGSERNARWRARKAISARAGAAAASGAGCDDKIGGAISSSGTSLSLFPEDLPTREQKQTRARPDDDGFAELAARWPLTNRMADAEREYRRALKQRSAGELLALAVHYLETKPDWQSPQFLVNWLRTEPWRDPLLPLRTAPREVAAAELGMAPGAPPGAEPAPREDWLARLGELRRSGVWPAAWGPRWGERGCRAPPLDTGVGQGFARWFVEKQQERRAG